MVVVYILCYLLEMHSYVLLFRNPDNVAEGPNPVKNNPIKGGNMMLEMHVSFIQFLIVCSFLQYAEIKNIYECYAFIDTYIYA